MTKSSGINQQKLKVSIITKKYVLHLCHEDAEVYFQIAHASVKHMTNLIKLSMLKLAEASADVGV